MDTRNKEFSELEVFLASKILPDLKKGRPGFDAPHTVEVANWVKQILDHEPSIAVDRAVLLIAAYAHDWGYAGMFSHDRTLQFHEVVDAKKMHMDLGAQKVAQLLDDNFFDFLNDTQKQRCIHLVAVHDKLDALKDLDELILMEADTLSGLDMTTTKSQFDAASNDKYMVAVQTTRLPRFITAFGKRRAQELFQKRTGFYKE